MESRDYFEGQDAARDGSTCDDCPYAMGSSSYDDWIRGYQDYKSGEY